MVDIILAVLGVLSLGVSASTLLLLRRMEKSLTDTGPGDSGTEDRRPEANPIDEGFENLMRFSVGGKTGFEREEG